MSDEKESIRKGLIKDKELSEDGSYEVATYDAQLLKLAKVRQKLSEGKQSRNTVYELESLIRELEREAELQKNVESYDSWLASQVNLAFEKFDSGKAVFVDHDSAKSRMERRKAKTRNLNK
ncbi:hypothetical protein [Vibrio sp. SCSIO 43137]|uniref:hypothetical protein n=1 Tax=Vibrio sp. SCSIO 43137 TaxID=3021011 RepID=UPI0023077E09|nr:hypothetical protein [Vibrio sp. SCSIO 43137]WCE28822.1 hypothetical protein PK654_10675 [Vibrio sp. SCSIO 43137]